MLKVLLLVAHFGQRELGPAALKTLEMMERMRSWEIITEIGIK